MQENTSSTGPLPPKETSEIYKKNFSKGSKLIKEASQDYIQATEPHKKDQLKKSMSEALKAMNQILNNVLHEKGEKYEKKISDDYQNFITNANNETMSRLNKDISDAQKSL